jgi:DNA-directed RNA polymerase specialized sigma subunit
MSPLNKKKPEKKKTIDSPWASTESLQKAGPTASKSEIDQTFEAYKSSPSPDTAEPFLDAMAPDIEKAVKNYGNNNDDYYTQAQLIALQQADSYDPDKGASIRTHVNNGLHKLTQVRQERTSALHIPDNVHREKARIKEAGDAFKAEFDREPNLSELADATGLSIGQLDRINKYDATAPESMFESDKGDAMTERRSVNDMWMDYVYFELDPIDKKIFEWATGYHGVTKIPKSEMATKLKISAPAVSKRVNKIVAKIEEGKELQNG